MKNSSGVKKGGKSKRKSATSNTQGKSRKYKYKKKNDKIEQVAKIRHDKKETANFPTSIGKVSSVFTHNITKEVKVTHLIVFAKEHQIRINVNHVKYLENN